MLVDGELPSQMLIKKFCRPSYSHVRSKCSPEKENLPLRLLMKAICFLIHIFEGLIAEMESSMFGNLHQGLNQQDSFFRAEAIYKKV